MVRDQRGMTLVEVAVALALLTVLSASAMLTVATFLHGAEVSNAISMVVGDLAEQRMRAIATATRQRVYFIPSDKPASTVVTGYRLCTLLCDATDTIEEVPLPEGLGIEVPGGTLIEFTDEGRNSLSADTDLKICRIEADEDGSIHCQISGGSTKMVRVYGNTGVITY